MDININETYMCEDESTVAAVNPHLISSNCNNNNNPSSHKNSRFSYKT